MKSHAVTCCSILISCTQIARLVAGYRYSTLRTNLPREIMSYLDFPFIPEAMQGRSTDARRFPHHTEVRITILSWLFHHPPATYHRGFLVAMTALYAITDLRAADKKAPIHKYSQHVQTIELL